MKTKKTKQRMCAVCFDKCQMNVRLQWRRHRDKMTFHVCMACAEARRVNENSVVAKNTVNHTTIVTD